MNVTSAAVGGERVETTAVWREMKYDIKIELKVKVPESLHGYVYGFKFYLQVQQIHTTKTFIFKTKYFECSSKKNIKHV